MSDQEKDNRVLARTGARLLSEAELDGVAGGFAIVPTCTFDPTTCHFDGVCTPLPRCPA
jgi:hypothetical protein